MYRVKTAKGRGTPCRRPLLSRASILDDVLRANTPLYLVRNGSVIVIRTRPGLAVTRANVNHTAARIRDVPGTSLSASL